MASWSRLAYKPFLLSLMWRSLYLSATQDTHFCRRVPKKLHSGNSGSTCLLILLELSAFGNRSSYTRLFWNTYIKVDSPKEEGENREQRRPGSFQHKTLSCVTFSSRIAKLEICNHPTRWQLIPEHLSPQGAFPRLLPSLWPFLSSFPNLTFLGTKLFCTRSWLSACKMRSSSQSLQFYFP